MTFLEYVCEIYLGKPVYASMWHCPYHDDQNPSFSVRPPKPGFAVKFRCWSCDSWGDEFDLLKLFHPGENYSERVERIAKLRKAYALSGDHNHHRGSGTQQSKTPTKTVCKRCLETLDDCDIEELISEESFSEVSIAAVQELLEFLETPVELDEVCSKHSLTLAVIQKALLICSRSGLHPASLAARCDFVRWVSDGEAQHMAECDDDYCECICCRRAGGWSEEEIQTEIDITIREARKHRPMNPRS